MKVFVGKNCSPCKALKAWLTEQNIKIEQVLAEDNMEEAKQLGIKSLPTLALDDNTLIKGTESIIEYLKEE